MSDLLVEIGTEELPPVALPQLCAAFADGFRKRLAERSIGFADVESFAAPRRLALLVKGVSTRQPDFQTLRRGPAVAAAFGPDGTPSKAAEGFARSCGVAVEDLVRERTEKGEWLAYRTLSAGRLTAELVPALTEQALADLPIPRRMRWGEGEAEFVRPVHWICLMLGDSPVEGKVLGVEASARTWGHRFHHPGSITLGSALDYAERLRTEGFVEPSFERRRELIRCQVDSIASDQGLRAEVDPALLDEVTALVEWPCALLGSFDRDFLDVPAEVLIETMRKNQKYFPVRDSSGALQPLFIAVSNIESKDPSQVRAGNERVIRPRFTDAKFFWEQDRRKHLEDWFPRLETLVFQDKLGSMAGKSRRVACLARVLADRLGENPVLAERAALLAKCDLTSSMVCEFPALQGTIGRYYAANGGEDPAVSEAIEEHYLPRFAGDTLPQTGCGRVLAIADRLDTLVGTFGIDHRPSGTKDPYGLRRASIAVLRILIETPLPLNLRDILDHTFQGYDRGTLRPDTVSAVLAYMFDRLVNYYQELEIAADTVDAVLATGVADISDLDLRIRAVSDFRVLAAGVSLAAANKRIRNILAKSGEQVTAEGDPDVEVFSDPAEIGLWRRIVEIRIAMTPLVEAQDYAAVLGLLAGLREEVDAFFDQVMVMAEDRRVRSNRLALLRRLQDLFLQIADISRLQIEERSQAALTGNC